MHLLALCPWWLQAIERCGTGITYAQLLYNMSQALEQLSAQQGKLPPKLPGDIGGLFGGLVNKLVRAQAPHCLLTAICFPLVEELLTAAVLTIELTFVLCMSRCDGLNTGFLANPHVAVPQDVSVHTQMNGAMDMAGLSPQTPVLSANYPMDLNRPLAI